MKRYFKDNFKLLLTWSFVVKDIGETFDVSWRPSIAVDTAIFKNVSLSRLYAP